jgi:hypothetical protein
LRGAVFCFVVFFVWCYKSTNKNSNHNQPINPLHFAEFAAMSAAVFDVANLRPRDLAVHGMPAIALASDFVNSYRAAITPTEACVQYISYLQKPADQEVFGEPMLYPGVRVITWSETNLLHAKDFCFGACIQVHYFNSFSSSHS